ncbi:PREDICTED: regucalcin-like [Trachymyrmex cornetzi]|uniref:regucalcin-like n=1 Tax=Trachymyrmex cornetzi TaxID=471704 RepID=UPI00084F80D6|nr:PREDICTED: regucalcin-like [Trachymyrmex cornetzi]
MRRAICKYVSLVCILVALVHGQARKCVNLTIEKVTDIYGFSKSLHWDNCTQKLYFVNFYDQYIHSLDLATGVVNSAYVEHGSVGVIIPVAGTTDQFVVGAGKDVVLVTWDGNSNKSNVPVEVLFSLDSQVSTRTYDGKVDPTGKLWIGTMSDKVAMDDMNKMAVIPKQGSLYRIDDDLKPEKKISPVTISNGLAWNRQNSLMYYIDTLTQVVAYDYSPNNGTISNKKIVFDLDRTNLKGLPDGMTIDTNGNIWIALFAGSQVIGVRPKTGTVLCKIELPVENVISATFGGPLLDTLYVTTAGYSLDKEQNLDPQAGAVFSIKGLEVRGVPNNIFKLAKH